MARLFKVFQSLSDNLSREEMAVPPPMQVAVFNIPGGDKGTRKTLERMRMIVIRTMKDRKWGAYFRGLAIKITNEAGCKTKDFKCEAKSLFEWVRDNVKWIRDIRGFETLQYPHRTLAFGAGDAFRKDTKIIVRKKIDTTYKTVEIGTLENCFAEYDALSFNYERGQFEFKPIVAWYDKGVKPMYRIETRNHRVLDVSTKHLIDAFCAKNKNFASMALRRGIEAEELFTTFPPRHRPQLPFATKIPELGTVNHLTSEQMFLEGMYLAEGWAERHSSGARMEEGDIPARICIGVKDDVLFQKLEDSAKACGIGYTHTQSNGVKVLRTSDHKFRQNILTKFGKGSFEKTIPEEYMSISRGRMTELVGAYAAGDAYKPKDGSRWSKMANLIHNTSSSRLAQMLGFLHLVMGRPLHPMPQMNHMGSGKSPIWRLIERKNIKCYKPKIGDVAGAAIAKFEENGEAECCDITVLDNHNVVTEGGIVVHQCDDLCLAPQALMWVKIDGRIHRMTIKDLHKYFVPVAARKLVMAGTHTVDHVDDEEFLTPIENVTIEVFSIRGKNHTDAMPVWRRVTHMYHKTAPVDLLKITISGGRTITCTPNHKLYQNNTKHFIPVRAGELKVGDSVVAVHGMPAYEENPSMLSDEDLFMLGFWIADGCYEHKHGPKFACGKDEKLAKRVQAWAATRKNNWDRPVGASISEKGDVAVCSRALMAWMKELGFSGTSATKRIPIWVFELPDRQIASFLEGYFKGDGNICYNKTNERSVVSACSVNRDLLLDVLDLLNRLSIEGVINTQNTKDTNGTSCHAYRLVICSKPMIERFIEKIGNFRDQEIVLSDTGRMNYSVSWRTIRSIENVREYEVFDLEVEPDHTIIVDPDREHVFVADGFLTHNSILLATLSIAIGIPTQFRAIAANPLRKDQYSHVYVIMNPTGNGRWMGADPTVKSAAYGWESPVRYKTMDVEVP